MTFSSAFRLSLIAPPDAGRAADAVQTETANRTANMTAAQQHLDVVFRYALRLTRNHQQAEDLTQETMLRACTKWHGLRDSKSARIWLLRIATNLWTDQLRRKAQHQAQPLVEPPIDRGPSVGKQLVQQENVAQAMAALDQLPIRQRQVMHLITCEQLGGKQAAEVLGISPEAVKASLFEARKRLREQLRDLYDEVCGDRSCPTND